MFRVRKQALKGRYSIMSKIEDSKSKMQLLNDKSLAEMLDVSVAWVRLQKHLRKYGKENSLGVDPIIIGKTSRYRLSDVETWLAKQEPQKPTS